MRITELFTAQSIALDEALQTQEEILLTCCIAAGSTHRTIGKQRGVFPVIKKLGEDFSLIDL